MSQRITFSFFFVSIAMPLTVGAQQDSDAVSHQTVQTEGLALQMPATWSRLNDDDKTLLTLLAPMPAKGGIFRDNIRVKKYPSASGDDLDKILSAQEKAVGNEFKVLGYGDLSSGEPRVAWLAIVEKHPNAGQPALAMIDYMTINQGYLFVMHAMCETGVLDERRPTFDAIARSVVFTRPSSPKQNTASDKNGSRNSPAFEQGRSVGRYTFYAMFAAVGAWLISRLVKFVRRQ